MAEPSAEITKSSKDFILKVGQLLKNTALRHQKNTPKIKPGNSAVPPVKPLQRPILLYALLSLPYLLIATFLFSFYWDFNEISFSLFQKEFTVQGILSTVSISGLIGFATNWVAINMLFRPTEKRPLLGQGLIPAQKERIAYRLAKAVSDDLINPEIIKRKLKESEAVSIYRKKAIQFVHTVLEDVKFRAELKSITQQYLQEIVSDPEVRADVSLKILKKIDAFLEDKALEKFALKAYSYVKGTEMQQIVEEALQKLPVSMEEALDKLDSILDSVPEKIEAHSDVIEETITQALYSLINQLDVQHLVEENLNQYDEGRLENLIKNASNEQLTYIQYLGAILGCIGGLVIWQPVLSSSVLLVSGLAYLGMDALIYSINRPK